MDSPDGVAAWLLTADERGNPATAIDLERGDRQAWSAGNRVSVHVDGAAYFGRLHQLLSALDVGDWIYLTDWRIDASRRLAGPGSELGPLLASLARRGVAVRGLLWRSHPALVHFNQDANRVLSTLVNRAGGQLVADQRVRRFGSHHQKLLVVHRPDDPDRCIAFVVASTWPAAVVTTPGISATPTRCGSIPATAGGRPGTTSSWSSSARPCWTSTTPSGSAGRTAPPRPSQPAAGRVAAGQPRAPAPGAAAAPPAARTGRLPCRAGAAHLPGPVPEDPVRARRRAQHRPGVPQGPGTGAVAGLHRGPVHVVDAGRRRPRSRPAPRSRAAHDHRGAAAPGPRRADLRPGRPRRPMAGDRQAGRRRGSAGGRL